MMNEGFSYRYFAVPCWAAYTGLLLAALLLASCGDDDKTPTPLPAATAAAVTVESGGMALSATTSAVSNTPAVAPVALPAVPTVEAQNTETVLPVLVPDTQVVAGGVLRLYADAAPDAQPLAQYEFGAEFVVVEPGDDYDAYPVDMNGVRWYRVRAQDGLVGWVMADAVSP